MEATTLSYSRYLPVSDDPQPPFKWSPTPVSPDAAIAEYKTLGVEAIFAEHFLKLREIAENPSLWPTEAEGPSSKTIAWASRILQHLQDMELAPTRVVASAEGGAAICFVKGNKYSDLECLNTGEILGVVSNRKDRPIAWEVEQSAGGIAQAAVRIREFLNA